MATNNYSINQQRRVPIRRNGLFYDREQFDFDLEMGREYVEGDLGQTVVLYSVDLNKTNQDKLYGETKKDSIVYFPPIEVPCVFEIEPAQLTAYEKNKNLGVYQKAGVLKFGVYDNTLIELGTDIKVGDMIGVQVTETQMMYYQVDNDGRNNYDNQHMLFGTVGVYRSITASPVEKTTFNG